jgi:glycosyltransferase involved in cell wall biosynthesis
LAFAGKIDFSRSIPSLVPAFRPADVVHLHGQFAGFYGSMAARLARVPAVYTAHFPSFVTDWSLRNRIRNHLAESVTCSLSALTVTCSVTMEQEYLTRKLVSPHRICTVYNGVRVPAPSQSETLLRADLGLGADAPVVLGIGRFSPQKGFDVLLDAISDLATDVPDVQLVLAGDGEMRGLLEARARERQIADRVAFLGFRDDVADLLYLATVVVVPSRYEVFPLVPLEAMMAGKAVVASDLPVLREAIVSGRDGILAPPTREGLSHGLQTMLKDERKRAVLGAQAARRAAQEFGVERMASAYGRLYSDLSARRR